MFFNRSAADNTNKFRYIDQKCRYVCLNPQWYSGTIEVLSKYLYSGSESMGLETMHKVCFCLGTNFFMHCNCFILKEFLIGI